MPDLAAALDTAGYVEAELNYVIATGAKPVTQIARAGVHPTARGGRFETRRVRIHDGRAFTSEFDIEREGFVFVDDNTAVRDFYDEVEVQRVYYPETAALVRRVTGAAHVHVFDHTVRAGAAETQAARRAREPVLVAHNDYTDRSAPARVHALLPGEAAARLERRFAIVQTWRPIVGPVRRSPLALCDAQSIPAQDFVLTDLVYEHRKGEVMQLKYNSAHRWFYFPAMARDEVLVFKTYESLTDGRARFSAHTAFDDPAAPADAPARESIETRSFAFF